MAIRIGRYGPAEQAERARSRSTATKSEAKSAQQGAASADKSAATKGVDTVELRGNSAAVSAVREATEGLPEVDAAKVARLKAAIADGSYRANPEAIAGAMLDEAKAVEG